MMTEITCDRCNIKIMLDGLEECYCENCYSKLQNRIKELEMWVEDLGDELAKRKEGGSDDSGRM